MASARLMLIPSLYTRESARAVAYCWSMILSENRFPLFGIMLRLNHFRGSPPIARAPALRSRRCGRREAERVMMRRMSAAACAAALVGMLATPVESSARGGGFVARHGRGFHPVVRPIHRVHPFVHAHRPPVFHRPLVRHPLVRHAFHAARRHHRAVFS